MKKISLLGLLFLVIFAMHTAIVAACSCIMPAPPMESMEASAAVFSGTAISVEGMGDGIMTSGADPIEVTFAVSKVWKGPQTETITLTTPRDSAACGYPFEEGEEYLVYAYEEENGALTTGLCTRTTTLATASDDLAALGEGTQVTDEPQLIFGPETTETSTGTIIIALILLLVVISGIWFFWKKKK